MWGRGKRCGDAIFCGYYCKDRLAKYIDTVRKGSDTCQFVMRAHAGVYDVLEAAKSRDIAAENVVMMTMLRDPVKRVLSEFVHVSISLLNPSILFKFKPVQGEPKEKRKRQKTRNC